MTDLEPKQCEQCKRWMFPSNRTNALNWRRKKTCGDNCRVKLSQRHGKRGVPYDEWVPSEEEAAEIERRKLECRLRELGHLQVCERD